MTEGPMRHMSPTARHSQSVEACLADMESRPDGLTDAEAARQLALHGPNRLPEARARGPLLRLLAQFHNVLIYVLLGALQHWVDTGVILAVVLANAAIGFIQEGKADAAMAVLTEGPEGWAPVSKLSLDWVDIPHRINYTGRGVSQCPFIFLSGLVWVKLRMPCCTIPIRAANTPVSSSGNSWETMASPVR